jgi:alkanesulfonate monooxygenase SsuD/methylene tetrahydromethanopterin reductase-like flavin-dependent oxidoreductase (luciferase family)
VEAPRVSVLVQPSHTSLEDLFSAWETFEQLGLDGIWINDHFFPRWGSEQGTNFESMTLLAAMALQTRSVFTGILVAGSYFRNPDLFADMARTIDHLSSGRMILGIGAGWNRKDLNDYGYGDPSPKELLGCFESDLPRVVRRLNLLNPGPYNGHLPILIGGVGERVTIPLAALYADIWNAAAVKVEGPAGFREKSMSLDRCCVAAGRDPGSVERSVLFTTDYISSEQADSWLEAGVEHFIVMSNAPFDPSPIRAVVDWAKG